MDLLLLFLKHTPVLFPVIPSLADVHSLPLRRAQTFSKGKLLWFAVSFLQIKESAHLDSK